MERKTGPLPEKRHLKIEREIDRMTENLETGLEKKGEGFGILLAKARES